MLSHLASSLLPAVVSLSTKIPEDALSASVLGTERSGHGVVIREDGLLVTAGYLVSEAKDIWIATRDGATVPGWLVGYDYETGFGLVRPSMPLSFSTIPLGSSADLTVGDPVLVLSSSDEAGLDSLEASVVAKREFAGRWEYVLDEAIFTTPAHSSWAGASLVDRKGRLCGIGSLMIQEFESGDDTSAVNMFLPIDLLVPIIDDICEHGRRSDPARPWLGTLIQDVRDQLVIVGIYKNCPADSAGLQPGDVLVEVAGQPVTGLANCFRRVWSLGSAGVAVPMTVMRGDRILQTTVKSEDRDAFQPKGTVN